MIELIPAIDIIDGHPVRLTKGDYDCKTQYSGTPLDMAKRFEAAGFKRLHIVDLDGARSKHVINIETLNTVARNTSLVIDFGGGIKSDDDIKKAFDNGAAMVTVGSVAVTEPELFYSWIQRYGAERIILGADVRNQKVSINGWKEDSDEEVIPFLKRYIEKGIRNILCTDISKDGTLAGPARELYKTIMKEFPDINLIASGGVSCVEDLRNLNTDGIPSVVFGKAIYEGRINIDTLIENVKE